MVSPLAWNVGFAVGHPEIDAQHRHLVVLINEIIAAVEQEALETVPQMLSGLAHVAAEHFRAEIATFRDLLSGHRSEGRPQKPRLTKAMADVRIEEHWAQHGALLKRLNDIGGLPPHVLCAHLKDWFVDHAIKQDSRLRAVFQAI